MNQQPASSVPRSASLLPLGTTSHRVSNATCRTPQSDNRAREAAALVSVRQEKNDNEELNNPLAAGD